MQERPKAAIAEVIAKAPHHQRGVGFSTAPEMRLVTQSKLRLFRTSGTRASGGATSVEASPLITSGAVIGPSIARILHLTMSSRAPQSARDLAIAIDRFLIGEPAGCNREIPRPASPAQDDTVVRWPAPPSRFCLHSWCGLVLFLPGVPAVFLS